MSDTKTTTRPDTEPGTRPATESGTRPDTETGNRPDSLRRYRAALAFPEYLETVRKHEELWRGVYERVRLPADLVEEARAVPGRWRLLALSEDWCGDAANILPVVSRLAERLPRVDLRVLPRDENLDIMDAHLTNGTSRSIPVVIVYDGDFRERAWWGPRPSELQEWVMTEGMKMEPGPRYAETRRFYARDRGRAITREIVAMLQDAAR